jgi:ubiquinone/menaquinone biosynthesis C-methylase UbiE
MSLRQVVGAQFRRPTGALGTLAGITMALRPSNRRRNEWTVEQLEIAPGDHVLELGHGPGYGIGLAAARAAAGKVVGIDHSAVMHAQARRRNAAAVAQGRVELHVASLENLPPFPFAFEKVFACNVLMFVARPEDVLRRVRGLVVPGGRVAFTHQPRQAGATAADARRSGEDMRAHLTASGFEEIRVSELPLRPVPAVCAIGHRPRG